MAEVCGLYGKEEVLWQSEPWDARAVAECDCVCVCVCVCVMQRREESEMRNKERRMAKPGGVLQSQGVFKD